MAWRVPLATPELGEEERRALLEAFDSGWPSAGPRTAAFESEFAAACGVPHAIAVSSGTAALHLALMTLDLAAGDEVVVPSLTFIATANAVVAAGGRPAFADIASVDDPCLDAGAVERVLTPRTRAIVAVHYGGVPCEMGALGALASARRLVLLEDAAHAAGAALDGRPAGSLGDIGCFSFYATKNLTTIEGGMVTTSDADRAQRLRRLRSHGLSGLSWERHLGASPDRDAIEPGLNYRFDDLRAAMGSAQLRSLAARNEARSLVVARYREVVDAVPGLALAFRGLRPGRRSSFHLAPLLVESGLDARISLARDLESLGIQTSHHYAPAHRMSCHATGVHLPVTDAFAARELTLPLSSKLTRAQVDLVVRALETWGRP